MEHSMLISAGDRTAHCLKRVCSDVLKKIKLYKKLLTC